MLRSTKRGRFALLSLSAISLVALVAGACGDDDDDDDDVTATSAATTAASATAAGSPATTPADGEEFDYGALKGELNIDGSSTVYPITEAVAEEFQSVAGDVAVTVGFVGSGGGGEKFCRGEISLWDASRPAKESDITKAGCTAAGVTKLDDLIEFQVGIDALTVVVNSKNDFAQCMTVEQLQLAFKDGGAKKWSDIDPAWPAKDIVFYYPGTDSGTYDYFVESIIGEDATHRTDGTGSEDDNVLALGVENDEFAIGYFGFAYFEEAGDKLNAVSVDGGNGCVEPNFDNALEGTYDPLSRPLFIYSSDMKLKENPAAVGFLNFLFENIDLVKEVGYITMPDDQLAQQVAKLEPYK